jgi:hypothetical protein
MGQSDKYGRKELVVSLFNHPERWTGNEVARKFLRQVLDSAHPQGLRFNDSNWYAETMCVFEIDGRKTEIPLILQIRTTADNGAQWVIAGIGDSHIFKGESIKVPDVKAEASKARSLTPSDYATNFLSLRDILTPGLNPAACISESLIRTDRGRQFITLVQKGELKFSHIGLTRFHIFQIPGFALLIEHFTRPSINSGWLISDIQPMPTEDLAKRKVKLLQWPL